MDNNIKQKTSSRIKELRLTHRYTMETLAEKIGVSKSTIAKWENGYVENMRQDNIIKLSELFNVPTTYIMGYDIDKVDESMNRESSFIDLYNQLDEDQKKLIDNLLTSLVSKK